MRDVWRSRFLNGDAILLPYGEAPTCGRKSTATSVREFSCESVKSSLEEPIKIKLTLSQIHGISLHDSSLGHQVNVLLHKKLEAIDTKRRTLSR